VRIDLHHQLYRERERCVQAPDFAPKRRGLRLAATLLARPKWHRAAVKALGWALDHLPRALLYHRFNAWGREREMPKPAAKSFQELYEERKR
jgi:L-lactate dehydrogenase complex protein LldF